MPYSMQAPVPAMFRLRIPAIWAFVKRQPASFWFLNIYMFFEYVRPQSIWTSLAILPWSMIAILLAAAAMILEGRLPHLRTTAGPLLVVFTGVLVLSSLNAINPDMSYAKWVVYFNWVLLYLIITRVVDTEKRFFVFMLAFLLYSFKMSQHGFQAWVGGGFSFNAWGVSGAPGWFRNSGEFGIQMCIFLPLLVEFILALRQHWGKWTRRIFYAVPVTIGASIVASSSRGALVGGACVGMWWVARSRHRVRSLLSVAALGAVMWVVLPAEQKARVLAAGDDNTSTARTERWEAGLEMAREHPFLGIGYNNWESYYGPLSHNIFIEAMSELGYTGLLAFLALIFATFWTNHKTRRLMKGVPTQTRLIPHMAHGLDGALIGFLASGFFVTVLYYPYFWVNLAMTVALHVTARNERARALARMRQEQERWATSAAVQPVRQPTRPDGLFPVSP